MRPNLVLILTSLSIANSQVVQVNVRPYDDFVVPDIKLVCSNYISDVVSKSCEEQLNIVCQNATLLSTMLDASSKFPYTGLGYSTRIDLGNFDQCMTVDHTYESGRILGEHCAGGLVIPDFFTNTSDINSYYKLSVCRPNGCTAKDFNAVLTKLINQPLPLFQDGACQTVETNTDYTTTDIITILIISICVLLMIVSSIYDFYLHRQQLECPNQLYLAFSVISNGKKLLHVSKQSKEQIHTFQGIRVISMMWVVAGHGLLMWPYFGVENAPVVDEWQRKMSSVYIYAAPLAVDTFFFISGFLVAYQYLKQKPKPIRDHVKAVPSMYLHRYLRLTPALAMVYLVVISLKRHLGSGPMWSGLFQSQATQCKTNWWSFLLYIQNYYIKDTQKMCMGVTWYLNADMQMFLLSPFVLIPIALLLQKPKGLKWSMIMMFILNLFFIALPLTTKLVFREYTNNFETHSRLIDYFIGAMLGTFMRINQDKLFLYMIDKAWKVIINLLIWIIVLLGMFAVFMYNREIPLHHGYESNAIFNALMRPAWCIGLSWIVYSGHHGYGGIVNWILCRPLFQVWGRLTYCMYLLHMEIIFAYFGSLRTRLYFSDYNGFYLFCGHFTVTLILAVFWTLAFESPLIIVEKIIFGRGESGKGNKKSREKLNGVQNSDCIESGIKENAA